MDVKNTVKTKLLQYLSKEITKQDLYKWSLDLLHKILKGDVFYISYLEIWVIITELTEINDLSDSYCDDLVYRFSEILMGNKCASFAFAIQIPPKFVVNNLSQTKQILQKYYLKKQLSGIEVSELISATQKTINSINTLNEMLELQIINLLNLGYEFYADEGKVDFNLKKTIFVSEDMSMSLESDFLEKIFALLECYEGKKYFCVHTNFNKGTGSISIQT